MQVIKHTGKRIYPGFETQGRDHQKPKTWVSVDLQKGLASSKSLKLKPPTSLE